jgi:hypothetical protein
MHNSVLLKIHSLAILFVAASVAGLSGCASKPSSSPVGRSGYHVVKFDNGDQYAGNWSSNRRYGEGTYTWANGVRYKGQFFNNMLDGEGVMTYTSGDNYAVKFKKDKPWGLGIYTYAGGATEYIAKYGDEVFVRIPFGPVYQSKAIACGGVPTGWWMHKGRCGSEGPEGDVLLIQNDGKSRFSGPYLRGKPSGEMAQYFVSKSYYCAGCASFSNVWSLEGKAAGPNAFTYAHQKSLSETNERAFWGSVYQAPILGGKANGKGQCPHNGAWEPCEFRNGERVDSVQLARNEVWARENAAREAAEKREEAAERARERARQAEEDSTPSVNPWAAAAASLASSLKGAAELKRQSSNTTSALIADLSAERKRQSDATKARAEEERQKARQAAAEAAALQQQASQRALAQQQERERQQAQELAQRRAAASSTSQTAPSANNNIYDEKKVKEQRAQLAAQQAAQNRQAEQMQAAAAQQIAERAQRGNNTKAPDATARAGASGGSSSTSPSTSSSTSGARPTVYGPEQPEAVAVCWQGKKNPENWWCDGPTQYTEIADPRDKQLGYAGCENPRATDGSRSLVQLRGEPTEATVFLCGYGLLSYERDIVKKYGITVQRNSYQCAGSSSAKYRCRENFRR